MRTLFAVAIAGLVFAAVSGTAHATPIAPLPQGHTVELGILSDVSWRRCWRDRWGQMHCRRCWRDSWGRVRCRPSW
jgi:hypothetical protein